MTSRTPYKPEGWDNWRVKKDNRFLYGEEFEARLRAIVAEGVTRCVAKAAEIVAEHSARLQK
jgi:hypothetical protein